MYELLMRPVVRLQIAVVELREREDGQTTTEYAILLGFLAIAIIIALFFLQGRAAQSLLERGKQRLQRAGLVRPGHRSQRAARHSAGRTLQGAGSRDLGRNPLVRPVEELTRSSRPSEVSVDLGGI